MLLALFSFGISLRRTWNEKREQEASPEQNELVTYTNDTVGYTLKIAKKYQIEQSKEKEAVLWRNPNGQEKVLVRFVTEKENEALWFGKTPLSDSTLGGIAGKKYMYKHCDMLIFCSSTVSYVIPYREKFLGLEFRTENETLDPEQTAILESFTLTQNK